MENRKIDAIKNIICLLLFFSSNLFSQNLDTTGYKFNKSNNVKNTLIDLTYFNSISLPPNYSIEFDYKIDKIEDFGYILSIKNQIENNFVLTYFHDFPHKNGQFILSNTIENRQIVKININENILKTKKWLIIKIFFDYFNQKIEMKINDFSAKGQLSNKNRGNNFKISFGEFENISAIIKNIKINDLEDNRLMFHWPLNQTDGNIVNEIVQNHFGNAQNGVWMKKDFNQFKFINEIELKNKNEFIGENIILNENDNDIVFFLNDEIVKYNLINNNWDKIKKNKDWTRYLFYNPVLKKYFRMQAGLQKVTSFDEKKLKFETDEIIESDNFKLHAFTNSHWFNWKDSCLYIFGGYGWYKTYNDLYKYDFKLKKWNVVKTGGQRIEPRGTNVFRKDSNTVLLLGGRGNYTGEQIFVFHNYADLWSLDLNTYNFKKLKDFDDKSDSINYGNFVITPNDNNIYCIKTNGKDNYFVKIDGKNYNQTVISKLNFNPIKLYCNDSLQKIFSISIENSKYKIYSINCPPIGIENSNNYQSYFELIPTWAYYIFFTFVLIGGTNYFIFKSFKKQNINVLPEDYEDDQLEGKTINYKIKYFGNFSIFNFNDENITNDLQTRVKELFLAITILSQKNVSGVLVEEITNILWPGKSVYDTKGVRGITVKRLKEFLAKNEIGTLEIKHKRFYFVLNENKKVDFVDFQNFEKKLNNSEYLLNEKFLMNYLNIVSDKFLINYDFEWLNDVKTEINKKIIFTLHKFLHFKMNDELKDKLIEKCLFFDELDEKAMIAKIQFLDKNNKKIEAKKFFEDFCTKYEKIKDSSYPKHFYELI